MLESLLKMKLKHWKSYLIISLSLFCISCGVHVDQVLKYPDRGEEDFKPGVTLNLELISGELLEVNSMQKPLVMIFAQDTCETCGKETEMLVNKLSGIDQLNVNLVTILIGTALEDARWWAEMFEVSWPVALDFKGEYFKRYCPQTTVPCIVIVTPDVGVVVRHHGEMSYEQMVEYTGPWF